MTIKAEEIQGGVINGAVVVGELEIKERIEALEKKVAELEKERPGQPEHQNPEYLEGDIDSLKICEELLDVLVKHRLSLFWLDHILDLLGRLARERSPIQNIRFK